MIAKCSLTLDGSKISCTDLAEMSLSSSTYLWC